MNHLKDLHRASYFIGIDSDGCVFDTMESKHRHAFVPALCEVYELEHLAPLVEEVWTGINLFSRKRGINRFHGLADTIDELRIHPVLKRFPGVLAAILPDMGPLREWMDQSPALSNGHLAKEIERRRNLLGLIGHGRAELADGLQELERCLAWSIRSNELAEAFEHGISLFNGAVNFLKMLRPQGAATHDPSTAMVVVSQASGELLHSQWESRGLDCYVDAIHGQEAGSKPQILRSYVREHGFSGQMLFIGDSPCDLEAAQSVGASFFPILPHRESESWERLSYEAWPIFVAGGYTNEYQNRLTHGFFQCLADARREETVIRRAS